MAEPKRGSVAAFKAAEERRKARLNKASAPKSNARKEAFNKKVASINKSRIDQGSVSKFKAAEERRQQRLAKVNQPKYGSPKMKRQRAMADVEKDLPKAKVARTTTASAMGADRVANRATKVADAGKTAKPIAAPKAEASTPKKSADLSGFGAAFKKARAQGVGTKFAYNDKQYAAVTKDDISRAGKSSLKEFLESSKRKATTELAKAPGQIVKKRYGGRISVRQEDIQKARKKASDEARKRNIELKNRSGAAVTENEMYRKQSGGMISDERKKRIAEMMKKAKDKSRKNRQRMDLEKMKEAIGNFDRGEMKPMPSKPGDKPRPRPLPMDPNMQREAKPMPMRPGVRPEGKKYERPIGRPELKERPMRRSGAAISEGEMQSFMEQMNKPRSMDRFKSGGSVMARGCKMGRKKATKLY
jgi:hypothetical protein